MPRRVRTYQGTLREYYVKVFAWILPGVSPTPFPLTVHAVRKALATFAAWTKSVHFDEGEVAQMEVGVSLRPSVWSTVPISHRYKVRSWSRHRQNGSYPVVPDSDGKVVVKDSMVKAIESVVSLTGGQCREAIERRLFGGHLCRVGCSGFWVAQYLDFMRLQMIARWSSQVILRYTSDAPLQSAVSFNSIQCSSSSAVVESMSRGASVGVYIEKLKHFMSETEADVREMRI